MVNPYQAYFFACFDQNIMKNKCQMKSMTYTVLESHGYDNVLVIKYFCPTTNFSHTYARTYSDLSNLDEVAKFIISSC